MEETAEGQEMPMEDSSTQEGTRRWGFRRSTIARREFMEEIGSLDINSLAAPCRGKRQARGRGRGRGRGKAKEASEVRSNSPAPKRGRGGRRSAPANLTSAPSPIPTEQNTSLELCAGLDNKQSEHSLSKSQTSVSQEILSDIEAVSEAPVSDQAEDSDELTLKQLQERARNRQKLEEASALRVTDLNLNTNTVCKDREEVHEQKECLQSGNSIVVHGACKDARLQESSSLCIHRDSRSSAASNIDQKLARGNGKNESEEKEDEAKQREDTSKTAQDNNDEEDPNALYCICRQTHNNRFMICCDRCQEWFHGSCVGITEARGRLLEENGEDYICPSCSPCQSPVDFMKQPVLFTAVRSSSSESLLSASAGEDRPSEDERIKGKIRKAATHSKKRKFKIFQQVGVVSAVLEHQKEEQVKQEGPKEKAGAPKCIGPGCVNDALPESVYCGHQCIIKHAAVAMQTISEPKAQPQIQTKPAPKPVPKIQKKTFLEKLFKRKLVEKPVKEEDCSSKEAAVSLETVEPIAAPLSTDPEPKTSGVQESSAIATSVFYTSTLIKEEKEDMEIKMATKQDAPQSRPPDPPASLEGPQNAEKTEKAEEKAASPAPPLRKPGSNPLPSRAKKTMPGSPRLAGLKKQSQSQETTQAPPASSSATEIRVLPVTPAPVAPSRPLQVHPNMQMRQNIRRSLTDTLLKRVNESDELEISESDIGKLAVNIEREMFNMYYTTDNKYKNKYRTLLMSLKDPKNKSLFYQVIKGQITPFKLTRLNQQELQCIQEIPESALPLKEEPAPVCVNMEEQLSVCEEKVVKTESDAPSLEEKSSVKYTQPRKVSTAVSDIISSMLKDTTSEHKTHLFDLKCRICTGQIPEDDDPDAKKFKKEELKEEEQEKEKEQVEEEEKVEEKTSWVIQMFDRKLPAPAVSQSDSIIESPASPTADDSNVEATSSDFSPLVIPEVSVVSITRRDPRTAAYRPASSPLVPPTTAPASAPSLTQLPTEKEAKAETKPAEPLPLPLPPPMPKSILMKPSVPSVPKFYSSSSSTTRLASSHPPTDSETSQFLSKQGTVWKGFLNMQNVAKFVTKGYLISGSGSAETLKKDLPDTVHIGGRILPQTVWDYVEKVKTSVTKELSLIRFHPATEEEEVAYVSLFSYFNSRRRFGVVSNICNNIKDLYLIPLCAKESLPSSLLPLEGPGLEEQHPNLLIGLAVCQKLKRLGAPPQEIDEKRPRIHTPLDSQGAKPTISDSKPNESEPYDPDIPISTTPPGSPPTIASPDSSSSSSSHSGQLSNILSVVNPPTPVSADTAKITSSNLPPPSGTCTSSSTTPLQTILNTLFGKKKQDSDFTGNTGEMSPLLDKEPSVSTPTVDPIVVQYQQTPKNTVIEKMELNDPDRPYDPEEEYNSEEEYDPEIGFKNVTSSNHSEVSKPNIITAAVNEVKNDHDDERPYDPEEEYNLGKKVDAVISDNTRKSSETEPSVDASAVSNDIAYDPEDETVFEEMQTYLADNRPSTSEYGASTVSLSEQQKMLEELNRQIEEQKRQLEEQEEALRLQRAAVGVSMAHFSVSDALMSPPPCFGREPDEKTEKTPAVPAVNFSRDPRQCRNLRQDAAGENITTVHNGNSSTENERKQALTRATFLAPSHNSVLQEMSKSEQELKVDIGRKDPDKSSVNTVDQTSSAVNKKESHSTKKAHQSASELEEGAYSSSGNENSQHSHSNLKDLGKTRSRSSKLDDRGSPRRRSRHERRSHGEERSSRVSRDKEDRYHRSRRSPERSSSQSRSHRKERVSSWHKDQHHHRSSSRHRSRRDSHSSRSRSTQRRKSTEKDESYQRDRTPSRKRTKPSVQNNPDQAQSMSAEAPQSDQLQNEASEDRDKNVSEVQKGQFTKTESSQPSHKGQPPSAPSGVNISQCDQFPQNKQLPLRSNRAIEQGHFSQPDTKQFCHENKPGSVSVPQDHSPQMDRSIFPNPKADNLPGPQKFQSGKPSQLGPARCPDNSAHTSRESSLQRDDFPQEESDRFHHRNHPQYEHSVVLQSKNDQLHNIRKQRSNVLPDETVFSRQKDEQSFGSLQLQKGNLYGHEADRSYFRNKSLCKPPNMQVDNFPNSDPDQCYNKDMLVLQPSPGQRNFPQGEVHQSSTQRPNFEEDQNQPQQRNHQQWPPQMQRRDITVDEKQIFMEEGDELDLNAERILGNFPLEESLQPGYQRAQLHRPPHLKQNALPDYEQTHFENNPSHMSSPGSIPVDEGNPFNQHDPPQGPHSVMRADMSQGEHDIPRNFCPRPLFRPRAPGDQWRGPQHRTYGPRGPPSLMTPRGPTAMRLRMPSAPHPERFENCGPGQNLGPRVNGPRPMVFDDTGASPNFRPRGPSSGPERFENCGPGQNLGPRVNGPRPMVFDDTGASPNFRPRGPSSGPGRFEHPGSHMFRPRGPDTDLFEEVLPQSSEFKGRFPGPGISESIRPQNFGPMGSSSGFRPGPFSFQQGVGGPSGPRQPRHTVPPGSFNVGGPPRQQFENNNSQLLNEPRGPSAPQFEREHFPGPQEPRHFMQRQSRAQSGIPMCGSPPHNQPEGPEIPEIESGMRGPQQFNEFKEQEVKGEMGRPNFEKTGIVEGGGDHENNLHMKDPDCNPPQNLRGRRAPSPHFPGQQMPAPWNKEFADKPCSHPFPSKIAPTSTHLQRPKAGEIQNPQQQLQPQVRFDAPTKEPDIRPLRLSGPLLPTPPGGPIRLHNPRMHRPYVEHRPQGPPVRGHNAGMKPGLFDDNSIHPRRQTSQERQREEPGNRGEDSSGQDSSPGKSWRRRQRRREGKSRATRRHILHHRESAGETEKE